jgi:hypothetical protein
VPVYDTSELQNEGSTIRQTVLIAVFGATFMQNVLQVSSPMLGTAVVYLLAVDGVAQSNDESDRLNSESSALFIAGVFVQIRLAVLSSTSEGHMTYHFLLLYVDLMRYQLALKFLSFGRFLLMLYTARSKVGPWAFRRKATYIVAIEVLRTRNNGSAAPP